MAKATVDVELNLTGGLVVRPGDVLIVTCSGMVSMEQADRFKAHLMTKLPGLADVVILGNSAGVAAYRTEDAPAVPHSWQEFNPFGNSCHYPGCTKTEEEH